MTKLRKILILCCLLFFVFTIKIFASENEELITYSGISTTMPKLSDDINGEDPITISRDAEKSVTYGVAGAGIDNENISSIISKFSNNTTVVGIDVSRHQGTIDWKKVADNGVKFAIIRCGYRGLTSGGLYVDPKFEENAKGALENGIYIGAYFYSTALNEEEALQEAILTYDKIKNYNITYPVYYDFEDFLPDNNRTDYMSVEQINTNARIFISYLKSKGYNAALYGSASYLKDKWDSNITSNNDIWVAHYYVDKPNYSGNYQIWQYTDKASVPGISGKVDVNVDYYYWASMNTFVLGMAHVQGIGWDNDWINNEKIFGTTGKSKRLEAIRLKINSNKVSGGIEYRTYVEDTGWENTWKKDGEISGTSGQAKRIEAIQIKLTGDMQNFFDIYYRTHCQGYGWLDWSQNGQSSGTEFLDKRIEAIEIKLIPKNSVAPGTTENRFVRLVDVKYMSHVQRYGWMNYVVSGNLSGTTGQGLRIEAMSIKLTKSGAGVSGGIEYKTHIQGIGWESVWKRDGQLTGTQGQSRRLEAIQIILTGEVAESYDIYYRTHCQHYGWLGWAKNGELAGTQGFGKRMEAIEIRLIPKGYEIPISTTNAFIINNK